MSKQYVALHDNLFIKEIKPSREIGSMIIPDSLDDDFTFGVVVSAGDGTFTTNGNFVPMSVTVGDEVCFPKTMGQKIRFVQDEEELILVRESALTAKIANVEVTIDKK